MNTQHTQPIAATPEPMLRRVGGVRTRGGYVFAYVVLALAGLFLLGLVYPACGCIGWMAQSTMTRVMADINAIEAGLTEILADSNKSRLEQMFNPEGVAEFMMSLEGVTHWPPQTPAEFEAATALYSIALYGVLRSGSQVIGQRGTLGHPEGAAAPNFAYDHIFRSEALAGLTAARYVPDLGADPWGNLYNIYPGPWMAQDEYCVPVTIPFRVYLKPERELPGEELWADDLTLDVIDTDGMPITVGWPAQRNRLAFIWSNGANLESSQANYLASPEQFASAGLYSEDQDPEFWGGGDDINNWDPSNSFSIFY